MRQITKTVPLREIMIPSSRFSVDCDVLIGGYGLFGGRGEYMGKIKLFDLGRIFYLLREHLSITDYFAQSFLLNHITGPLAWDEEGWRGLRREGIKDKCRNCSHCFLWILPFFNQNPEEKTRYGSSSLNVCKGRSGVGVLGVSGGEGRRGRGVKTEDRAGKPQA